MSEPPPSYPGDEKTQQQPYPQQQPIVYQPVGGNNAFQQPGVGMMQPNRRLNHAMLGLLPMKLGRNPVQMKCPTCSTDITTEVRDTSSMCMWVISILLCSFLLFIFAWIPFCITGLKDTVHTCPHCKCYCGFHRAYAPGY